VAQQAQQVDLDQNGPVEVGKAHGAGAHLCGFKEVELAVLSTCSAAASSTNSPGRCRMSGVVERVQFEGAIPSHTLHSIHESAPPSAPHVARPQEGAPHHERAYQLPQPHATGPLERRRRATLERENQGADGRRSSRARAKVE